MSEFYGYVLIAISAIGLVYFISQMILSYISRVPYSTTFDDLTYYHQGFMSDARQETRKN